MAQKGPKGMNEGGYPDRKAHANLADVENRLLAGLSKSNPSLVDSDGTCPQCVSLEYELADEYQAQATASEMTDS